MQMLKMDKCFQRFARKTKITSTDLIRSEAFEQIHTTMHLNVNLINNTFDTFN